MNADGIKFKTVSAQRPAIAAVIILQDKELTAQVRTS
jgi:hypothetical protein